MGPVYDPDTNDTVTSVAALNTQYFTYNNQTATLNLLPSKLLKLSNNLTEITFKCKLVLTDSYTQDPGVSIYILYFVVPISTKTALNNTIVSNTT